MLVVNRGVSRAAQPSPPFTKKKGFTRCLQGSASVTDPPKGSVGEDEIYDSFVLVKVL